MEQLKDTTALLIKAKQKGLRLSFSEGKLRVRGPQSAKAVADELLACKPEILAFLTQQITGVIRRIMDASGKFPSQLAWRRASWDAVLSITTEQGESVSVVELQGAISKSTNCHKVSEIILDDLCQGISEAAQIPISAGAEWQFTLTLENSDVGHPDVNITAEGRIGE